MPYLDKDKARACAREGWRRNRAQRLGRRYGLTGEEYEALTAPDQCNACGSSEKRKGHEALYVDHDHVTGKIRGILCHSCNLTLGNAKDDPTRLRALADYLERKEQ